jgi:ABC-2 type transport system ATP-binding protein
MSEKIIEVKHLAKKFGKTLAVEDVSFDVYAGDVFGFLGPNGAGKSTTIRAMLSLITPDAGEIRLFGMDLRTKRNEILSRITCRPKRTWKYQPESRDQWFRRNELLK